MKLYADKHKAVGEKLPLLFGQFLEHFHWQIYGGVYDPGNPLSNEDGFCTDVIDIARGMMGEWLINKREEPEQAPLIFIETILYV